MKTFTAYKAYNGIILKVNEKIQCATYGTCKVTALKNDKIYVKNTMTNEEWDFDDEGWIAGNWHIITY